MKVGHGKITGKLFSCVADIYSGNIHLSRCLTMLIAIMSEHKTEFSVTNSFHPLVVEPMKNLLRCMMLGLTPIDNMSFLGCINNAITDQLITLQQLEQDMNLNPIS